MRVKFVFDGVELSADLLDTPTAARIRDALPIEATARIWGEEVYLPVAVKAAPEPDARAQMREGDIALWLDGPAIAICFGHTPAGHYRLISPGNVFARALTPVTALAAVRAGTAVRISLSEG